MKKLVIALSVVSAVSLCSCIGEGKTDPLIQQEDTTKVDEPQPNEVIGVAIGGAMNSVDLKVGDDTIEFAYPDLDGDHRASWNEGDTLTVRYYVTENGDSVTDVINHGGAS
jgi:hypothetical protein